MFFGIAAWNVGSIQYPQTSWQNTQNESFYINLGSTQQVKTVYCWVVSGNATANISSGTPGNWNSLGSLVLEPAGTNYQVFVSLDVNTNTQYLNFNLTASDYDSRPMFSTSGITSPSDKEPSPFIQISEIGIQSQNNEQIKIVGVTGENTTDPNLTKMVDEQNSLQIPPTYMQKMYFDEVYFARSAENYLHHQIPDERTHPPLGKLIQASGLVVFGDNPFGWRILGVIFATLMIPLMYLLGKKLFGTWIGGFSAAFLLAFDFMHFTMARIGTADTYVVFFALLSQLFFFIYIVNVAKNGWKTSVVPLFLTVIFFGLGFSTKWFTLFGAAGMLVLLVAFRLKDVKNLKGTLGDKYVAFFNYPAFLLLGFIGIAIGIYFVTYIPDVLAGDSWATIFNLQNAMFGFHSGLTSPDSFSSPWWSWPFMVRPGGNVPRWFDITYLPNNVNSTISAFGNPIVWWIGFAAIVVVTGIVIYKSGITQGCLTLIKELPRKQFTKHLLNLRLNHIYISAKKIASKFNLKQSDLPIVFITVVFLFSWLPYALISRATYTYHFYLSVPLLCLALTYFINKYWEKPIGKVVAVVIFVATVGMFIAFFPVISGMPVSNGYIHNLKWFQSWFFAP